MSSGKLTEHITTQLLRGFYKSKVDIQRLPDKYDTGKFEDTRPSDFMVHLSRSVSPQNSVNTFYIECKETKTVKPSFNIASTFRKGQVQAMWRALSLQIPYFVVFHFLDTRKLYLVPSVEILKCLQAGKKSISFELIAQYTWTMGELNDYFISK